MTDKLIMTTAEREQSLTALKEVDALLSKLNQPRHRGLEAAMAMLQSLPMVSGEPVAYLAHYYIEPTIHTEADDGFDVVEPTTENAFPVFTSPQALTTKQGIVVTDEMAYAFNRKLTDAPISIDECEEIKQGLSAALAHIELPQALTKISADDVPDNLALLFCDNLNLPEWPHAKEIIAAAYNAVIKHKVTK